MQCKLFADSLSSYDCLCPSVCGVSKQRFLSHPDLLHLGQHLPHLVLLLGQVSDSGTAGTHVPLRRSGQVFFCCFFLAYVFVGYNFQIVFLSASFVFLFVLQCLV